MKKNLLWKLVCIVVVMLAFLFGIFGLPRGVSGSALSAAIQDRIHLGLDLKGGTHLILQVRVNEAINADSDQAVERLKDALRKANITYAEISKPDPQAHPERLAIKGVPVESRRDLTDRVSTMLPDYEMTSGPENSWVLSMKPGAMTELKKQA